MDQKNILMVDDDEDLLEILSESLKTLPNISNVDTVFSVDLAIDKIKTNNYDLIITDIRMPEKNGLDLILHFRKINYSGKIIVMSAYEEDIRLSEIRSYGIIEIISKPFDVTWFKNKIKNYFQDKDVEFVQFDSINLLTVLQIINIEKKSLVVDVTCNNNKGYIYMLEGEILHSEYLTLEGESALMELVYLKASDISLLKLGDKTVEKTIDVPFDELIFKILKNIDEKQRYIEDKPYNTKEDKMFENVFDEFETISGFVAAGIYDGTGKILTSTSNTKELDFNEVGEQAIKLYKAAKEVCSKIKIGTTNFIETHTDNFTFIHTCIVPSKGAIGVVLKKNGNIGMTRYHMNEVVNKLRPQFK